MKVQIDLQIRAYDDAGNLTIATKSAFDYPILTKHGFDNVYHPAKAIEREVYSMLKKCSRSLGESTL